MIEEDKSSAVEETTSNTDSRPLSAATLDDANAQIDFSKISDDELEKMVQLKISQIKQRKLQQDAIKMMIQE